MKRAMMAALAIGVAPSTLAAQLRVETGGGEARLDQLPPSSLTSFGGSAAARFGPALVQLSGTTEEHFGLGMAGSAAASVHYRVKLAGWTINAGPVARAARGIAQRWSGTLAGDITADHQFGPWSVHAGFEQGAAQTGSHRASWRRPGLGAQLQLGQWRIGSTWQATVVQDSVLRQNLYFNTPVPNAALDTLYRSRVRQVHDVALNFTWSDGSLTFNTRMGRRFGAGIGSESWWEAQGAVRMTPMMSLTMQTGYLPSDLLLGLRGGQYTTVGLRFDLAGSDASRHRHRTPYDADRVLAQVLRLTDSTVTLRLTLDPNVEHASLTGDLTDWRPRELRHASDGRWEIELRATAGVFRFNVSADDGPWIAPPGMPSTDDGFGSRVGLLVLER